MWDKKASTRAHMCQSVRAACKGRMWRPTCEGVQCLLWECVWCGDVGGGELCQADGEALYVISCPTRLPVDRTSVNSSVCGEKVAGREVLLLSSSLFEVHLSKGRDPQCNAAAERPVTEDVS